MTTSGRASRNLRWRAPWLQKKQPKASSAGADFENISRMSRELISALYETVWAVNPENDNLEKLHSAAGFSAR